MKIKSQPLERKETTIEKTKMMKWSMKNATNESVLATVKKALKFQQELKKYKSLIESIKLEKVEVPDNLEIIFSIIKPKYRKKIDCKHLSLEDVKVFFEKYKFYLSNIWSGKEYSIRHVKYVRGERDNIFSEKSLTFNLSMITFDYEQISYIATLMQKHFEGDECVLSRHCKYYFKVLIPEFCLKVFLDVYKMNPEDGIAYLKHMSLD